MTGTALTEAEEFEAIYRLDVVEIPTNKPVARIDRPDVGELSCLVGERVAFAYLYGDHTLGL